MSLGICDKKIGNAESVQSDECRDWGPQGEGGHLYQPVSHIKAQRPSWKRGTEDYKRQRMTRNDVFWTR